MKMRMDNPSLSGSGPDSGDHHFNQDIRTRHFRLNGGSCRTVTFRQPVNPDIIKFGEIAGNILQPHLG